MNYQHLPVMLNEVLEYLKPQPGENFIDCTLGGAGYTLAFAKKISPGIVLSIDLDQLAVKNAEEQIEKNKIKNIILANDNFKNLSKIIYQYLQTEQIPKIKGILFDLGLSSAQLQDRSRGFSFQLDTPLDMSFSRETGEITKEIVNNYPLSDLEKIIREYGEEKFSNRIAKMIINSRIEKKIITTGQLVEIIKKAIPKRFQRARLNPATKTFQALRIATNDELKNLSQSISQAAQILPPGGKIAVVSYHSLEDRIVKHYFRQEARDCLCPANYPACRCQHRARLKILTPRVIRPSEEECRDNPRARSAKLRVAEKINKT